MKNKMKIDKVLVISGPNLNLLGTREPDIYGSTTLEIIHKNLKKIGKKNNLDVSCKQSNSESEIIKWTIKESKKLDSNVVWLMQYLPIINQETINTKVKQLRRGLIMIIEVYYKCVRELGKL